MCLFSDEDDHGGFALLNLPFTLSLSLEGTFEAHRRRLLSQSVTLDL